MNGSGAGGSATNSGVNFQQRIAAFFALSMAMEIDVSSFLEMESSTYVNAIAFETEDAIDDVVVIHNDCKTFIQAKRKLSLSSKENSEFFKVIEQFMHQHRISQNEKDSFVLVTSGETSNGILRDVRKFTNTARLRKFDEQSNPLSKSEQESLGTLRACIRAIATKNGWSVFAKDSENRFFSKIRIAKFDAEGGGVIEKALFALILNSFSVTPTLIWNLVIAKCLEWSKNRQSVDLDGINLQLSRFRVPANTKEESLKLSIEDTVEFANGAGTLSSGREVVIVESPSDEIDVGVIELYRFNDHGDFRVKFVGPEIEFRNGTRNKLLARFSTIQGAERFLLSNSDTLKDKRVAIIPINGNHNYDADPIALAYSDKVGRKIQSAKDATICIHCSGRVWRDGFFIEVQEEGLPFDAGLIHATCQRQSDRILGLAQNNQNEVFNELGQFDYKRWIESLPRSQGLWNGKQQMSSADALVLWNPDHESTQDGAICFRITLADGSFKYIKERGKVQRYRAEDVEEKLQSFRKWMTEMKEKGDPLVYSADGISFGPKSTLRKASPKPIAVNELKEISVERYTRGISEVHDELRNYYAPLMCLVDADNGALLVYGDCIFLLTNPFEIKLYIENWNEIGFSPKSYKTEIIERDEDFDELMRLADDNDLHVIVDPYFDSERNLDKGTRIENMARFIKDADAKGDYSS